jgi:hypothetical protein
MQEKSMMFYFEIELGIFTKKFYVQPKLISNKIMEFTIINKNDIWLNGLIALTSHAIIIFLIIYIILHTGYLNDKWADKVTLGYFIAFLTSIYYFLFRYERAFIINGETKKYYSYGIMGNKIIKIDLNKLTSIHLDHENETLSLCGIYNTFFSGKVEERMPGFPVLLNLSENKNEVIKELDELANDIKDILELPVNIIKLNTIK